MDRDISLEDQYLSRVERPWPSLMKKAKEAWIVDKQGKKYLDCTGGHPLGHLAPSLMKKFHKQSALIPLADRSLYFEPMGELAAFLCQRLKMDYMLGFNSHAEAIETALKAARRWGYLYKGIKEHQAEIIGVDENDHGRSLALLSLTHRDDARAGCGPFMPGFQTVPFGSAEALERAITPHTCAFILEPLQQAVGMKTPPTGYLKKVEKICKAHNILLIIDERHTGLARTGTFCAYEKEKVHLDLIILGPALAGGILPYAALIGKKEPMGMLDHLSYEHLLEGNALAAAIALELVKQLSEKKTQRAVEKAGQLFLKELQKIESALFLGVRGSGLWIAIDVNHRKMLPVHVCDALFERGILCRYVHETSLCLLPPLNLSSKEIRWAISRIKEVLEMATLPTRKRRK